MSGLRTYCRRCRAEVAVQACDLSGTCVICLTSDAVQVDKAEYTRLWKKRAGYIKKGVSPKAIEAQLTRVTKRLIEKVHVRIGYTELAEAIAKGHFDEARDVAERGPVSRILLPNSPRGAMVHV